MKDIVTHFLGYTQMDSSLPIFRPSHTVPSAVSSVSDNMETVVGTSSISEGDELSLSQSEVVEGNVQNGPGVFQNLFTQAPMFAFMLQMLTMLFMFWSQNVDRESEPIPEVSEPEQVPITPVLPEPIFETPVPVTPTPEPVPVTPTPEPVPVTPTPGPVPVTPTPEPVPVTPTPGPVPVTPTPEPVPVTPTPGTPTNSLGSVLPIEQILGGLDPDIAKSIEGNLNNHQLGGKLFGLLAEVIANEHYDKPIEELLQKVPGSDKYYDIFLLGGDLYPDFTRIVEKLGLSDNPSAARPEDFPPEMQSYIFRWIIEDSDNSVLTDVPATGVLSGVFSSTAKSLARTLQKIKSNAVEDNNIDQSWNYFRVIYDYEGNDTFAGGWNDEGLRGYLDGKAPLLFNTFSTREILFQIEEHGEANALAASLGIEPGTYALGNGETDKRAIAADFLEEGPPTYLV